MTPSKTKAELQRQDQLESDQHLFEMYLNDHIENQVQRMMECDGQNPKIAKPLSFSEFQIPN
jgi:hypothetical protein